MRQTRFYRPATAAAGGLNMRLLSMIGMLVVLGMLISRAGDPRTWSWLTGDKTPVHNAAADGVQAHAVVQTKEKPIEPSEVIAAGPNDQDPDEIEAAREEYQAVGDRVPLSAQEMPAYWRMMDWSRAQSFQEMQQRARRDLLFTHLWERPAKYRGELTFLKLHVERVLTYDAPQNQAGIKQLYEAWGWSDDSKSFPYVVVFSDLPPGLKLGARVSEDVTFAGYFLKLLPYQAFDVKRAAPLLIGKVHWQENPARVALQPHDSSVFWLTLAGGGVLLLIVVARWFVVRRSRSPASARPSREVATARWLDEVEHGTNETSDEHREESAWGAIDLDLSRDETDSQEKERHA